MFRLLSSRASLSKLRSCRLLAVETKITNVLKRTKMKTHMPRTSEKLETKLRTGDMIPENFVIVYRGEMNNYIHMAYGSSLVMFAIGVTVMIQLYREEDIMEFPLEANMGSLTGLKNFYQLLAMMGTFFAIIVLMRMISVRYVLRMYYDAQTKTYRAVKIGVIPGATETHDFKAGTVEPLTKMSIVPWWNLQYICNGQKLLIFEHSFKTSADYQRMFVNQH